LSLIISLISLGMGKLIILSIINSIQKLLIQGSIYFSEDKNPKDPIFLILWILSLIVTLMFIYMTYLTPSNCFIDPVEYRRKSISNNILVNPSSTNIGLEDIKKDGDRQSQSQGKQSSGRYNGNSPLISNKAVSSELENESKVLSESQSDDTVGE